MIDVVRTKYVLVFMLFSLINMNKIINQSWLKCTREQCRRVRCFHDWTLCQSGLFDVAELCRCSADGHREVVETILMFTWGTMVRPPRCRGHSHSRSKRTAMWRCSPKTWPPAIPRRIFSVQRFRRPALASTVCGVLAMGMQRATKVEGRGLLSTL